MLIISNFLMDKGGFLFPEHAVVRVNVAWIPTTKELIETLKKIAHPVYLDYPQGRTKPPQPKISLEDTIKVSYQFPQVKYFAISNVEETKEIYKIKKQLPKNVLLIPKIETKLGIKNLEKIIKKINPPYIMLVKEDLYLDVNRDSELFLYAINNARAKSKSLGIEILELHGVVFLSHKHQE